MREAIITSGPITLQTYQTEAAQISRLRLKVREIDPGDEVTDILPSLETHSQALITAIDKAPFTGESFRDRLAAIRKGLDKGVDGYGIHRLFGLVKEANGSDTSMTLTTIKAEDYYNQSLKAKFAKEFPGLPNPFGEFNWMFARGLWPRDFREVEGRERFLVDIPIVVKFDASDPQEMAVLLGCWATGDKKLRFAHSLIDDCYFNFSLEDNPLAKSPREIDDKYWSYFSHIPPEIPIEI